MAFFYVGQNAPLLAEVSPLQDTMIAMFPKGILGPQNPVVALFSKDVMCGFLCANSEKFLGKWKVIFVEMAKR